MGLHLDAYMTVFRSCVVIAISALCFSASAETLDWSSIPAGGWPAGGTGPFSNDTSCNGSNSLTANFSDPQNHSPPNPHSGNNRPSNSGGTLIFEMNSVPDGEGTQHLITFSRFVENVTFSIFDVDGASNAWRDRVTISASYEGVSTPTNFTCGNDPNSCVYTIGGSAAARTATAGTSPSGFTAANGRLDISIPGPVDEILIDYENVVVTQSTTQFIGLTGISYECSLLGSSKTMSTTASGESPYLVDIDFEFENFGEQTLSNLSALDNLTEVFGASPTDFSVVSITKTSGPASFNVNSSFDGDNVLELVGSGSSLAPGQSASIRAQLSVTAYGLYTNQVTATGTTPNGGIVSDTSTSGTNADPNADDNPAEAVVSTLDTRTLPVTIDSVQVTEHAVTWTTETELGNAGFEIHMGDEPDSNTPAQAFVAGKSVNSSQRQRYVAEVTPDWGQPVWIADVDLLGNKTWHGPYLRGERYGHETALVDNLAVTDVHVQVKSNTSGVSIRGDAVNVMVDTAGMQRITHGDLAAAGFAANAKDATRFQLLRQGQPVPIYVHTPSDQWAAGAYIEFFAFPEIDLYSDRAVYTLTLQDGGLRISDYAALPSGEVEGAYQVVTSRVDLNEQYYEGSILNDPWLSSAMVATTSAATQRNLTLHANYPLPNNKATLTLRALGITDFPNLTDHHVSVSLNGQTVGDTTLDGLEAYHLDADVTQAMLAGSNTLTVTNHGDAGAEFSVMHIQDAILQYRAPLAANGLMQIPLEFSIGSDGLFADSFATPATDAGPFDNPQYAAYLAIPGTIDSPVAYAIDGGSVYRLAVSQSDGLIRVPTVSGAKQYWVSSATDLYRPALVPSHSAESLFSIDPEYLIITHSSLLSAAQQLRALRSGTLRTQIVTVEQIYAWGSHGRVSAQAIDAFIAQKALQGSLRFVAIAGSDTFDYHGYTGQSEFALIPSLYASTSEFVQYAPTDALYADINDDAIPDLAIGRLPARNNQELQEMVQRIATYEQSVLQTTGLFVADQTVNGDSYAAISDSLIANLPEQWTTSQRYLDVDCASLTGNALDQCIEQDLRPALLSTIEQGTALTTFVGHSGPRKWSFANLMDTHHTRAINNPTVPTVVMQFGCWNTYHVDQANDTLAAAWLQNGASGAAAVLGATTLTETEHETRLAQEIIEIIATDPIITLGEAVVMAKQGLASEGLDAADVQLGWVLLGDPAMRLNISQPSP